MKTNNIPMNEKLELIFDSEKCNVIQAKKTASKIFNNLYKLNSFKSSVNTFQYKSKNGIYFFNRINKIFPNGSIIYGNWN